jgi:hypothetical protein
MKEYTLEYVRNLGVQELMHYAEIYNDCPATDGEVAVVRDMLNNEVERRINGWEIAEV